MRKNLTYLSFLALLMTLQVPCVNAQQSDSNSWNQFRGCNRNGVVTPESPIKAIAENGPELLWKKSLGCGFSELTVADGVLYTMYGEKQDSTSGWEYVAAFDASTGDEIWRSKIDSLFFDTFGDGPRSTPAIGEEYIYSLSSYGKLTANSKKDGSIIWQVDFVSTYGSKAPRWAFCSSPMIVDNTIIVEVGGTESRAFMAFDKKTGKEVWATGKGRSSYNSPLMAEVDGKQSIIFANGRKIYALDTKGDTLWTHNSPVGGPTSMPIVFDSNKIFVSAIRSTGFFIMEVNDGKPSDFLKGNTMKNDYSSSIYYDGHFYGFHVAALQCISAETGEKKWSKRGFGKGSLIRVGDQLMVLSDKGELIQVKATGEAYTQMGSFQALEGKSWTAPSFAGGKIYVRNLTEMACYKLQ